MEAKLEGGRVILSENPTKSEGVIVVAYDEGGGVTSTKALEVREGQMAYDLPEGVDQERVVELRLAEKVESGEVGSENTSLTRPPVEQSAPAEVAEGAEAGTTAEEKVSE
jgi:hypothetical protein